MVAVPGDDSLSQEAQRNATAIMVAHVRYQLCSKRCLVEHRLTRDALLWVLGEVERRWMEALATPGEPVGIIAAQSLGEPTTQAR